MTQKHYLINKLKHMWGRDFALVRLAKNWWTIKIDGHGYFWLCHQNHLIKELQGFQRKLPFLLYDEEGNITCAPMIFEETKTPDISTTAERIWLNEKV